MCGVQYLKGEAWTWKIWHLYTVSISNVKNVCFLPKYKVFWYLKYFLEKRENILHNESLHVGYLDRELVEKKNLFTFVCLDKLGLYSYLSVN